MNNKTLGSIAYRVLTSYANEAIRAISDPRGVNTINTTMAVTINANLVGGVNRTGGLVPTTGIFGPGPTLGPICSEGCGICAGLCGTGGRGFTVLGKSGWRATWEGNALSDTFFI